MREDERNEYLPDQVSPPGDTLVDVLDALGMSQAELADRTGRPKKTINEIVKGKAMITSETAVQLERVLGTPASFWATREAHYRAHLAKLDEAKQLEQFIAWPQRFPLQEMRGHHLISESSSGIELVRELLTFFGIASPAHFDTLYSSNEHHFRTSKKFVVDRGALAAWLRAGELEAQERQCEPFDRQRFLEAIQEARKLTQFGPDVFVSRLQTLCGAAGVAVAFVPELPGIRTNGATRWISPSKALIQLSLLHKRNDILWFTFFHECGHIILHGKKDVFVEAQERRDTDKEREADAYAAETLIPSRDLNEFIARADFSKMAVRRFSDSVGVHPGIVVGRLRHDSIIRQNVHADLIMPLHWAHELP